VQIVLTRFLWIVVLGAYVVSWLKAPEKAKRAARAGLMGLAKAAPVMLSIVVIIGLVMAFVPPEWITRYLGHDAGLWATAAAAIFGALTLIPCMVALPLAASIFREGASVATVAAFISTLTMVGVVTAPAEIKYMGKPLTIWRNVLSFLAAIVIAGVMAVVLR